VLRILKAVRPDIQVVLGGPELSYEWQEREHLRLCDYLIRGEGEVSFYKLCRDILSGHPPSQRVMLGEAPDVKTMNMPYDLYDDTDIAHRVLYVEASRGCPFRCQFCLSSLDQKVRNFPLDTFLEQMKSLIDRGARQFKFVDRTFNLAPKISTRILSFFLENYREGLFLHFEMVPDRFPVALREWIERFPEGSIQFEVGIQTWNEEVAARISRRQKNEKIEENLRYLRNDTTVHLHTDLIVGLPGEDMDSLAKGFDRLVALSVQEIQVGILKRLPGAPIAVHTQEWGMIYSPKPPYEILRNRQWSFGDLARMRRFARYWDLIYNSGRFRKSISFLLAPPSAFYSFLDFSDWLYDKEQRMHSISYMRLMERIFEYVQHIGGAKRRIAQDLYEDSCRLDERRRVPKFLRPYVEEKQFIKKSSLEHVPERQRRHMLG
ncbi:MAG: DUF4080 domain-containing protein, partial [Myxococcota bacterium]|nr:DUF4080 domain-containing protein [Myxococcota bacterium]